jgi:hypothetical protein
MMDKRNAARAFGILLATMYATLFAIGLRSWLGMTTALTLLIFALLWVATYLTGLWAFFYRPAELDKKLPISGKERLRRAKEFFDSLRREKQ